MLFSPQLIIPTPRIVAAGGGGGGESTVLVDVTGNSAITSGSNVSSWLNIGSGSNGTTNMAVLFGLSLINSGSGASTPTSLIWDATGGSPQTATLLSGATLIGSPSNSDVFFFGLVNPHLGNLTVNATWTGGNSGGLIFAVSAVSADQTGGSTTFTNVTSNSGSGTSQSVTNAAPTNRLSVGTALITSGFSTDSGTRIVQFNFGAVSAIDAAYANSTTFSWTSSSGAWVANSISIKGV